MVIATKDILNEKALKPSILSSKYRIQWIAALSSHIITFSHGIAIGWFSPAIHNLQSNASSPTNFALSVLEASWVGTCWGIGSLIGIVLCGLIINKISRKAVMILLVIPHMVSWLCIYFAQNAWYFYAARLLAGSTGGAIFQIMPLFASEIADPCVRGALTSIIMTIGSVGTLVGYVISSYVNYFLIPWIVIIFPLIFLLTLLTLPETPHYLLQCGRISEAEKSYRYYKNIKCKNDPEMENFENLKNHFGNDSFSPKINWSDLTTKAALRATLLSFVLSLGNQFSGCFSITQYMSYIFEAADTKMDIDVCTMIVGVVQIIAGLFGVSFVDYIGRRRMMLASIGGLGLGWMIFGLYIQFVSAEFKIAYYWAPLAIMMFVVFTANFGMMTLITVILVEAFPAKIRTAGLTITMLFLSGSLSIQLKIYLYELTFLGAAYTMYIAAGVCAVTFLYAIFNLQETKNKQIDYD